MPINGFISQKVVRKASPPGVCLLHRLKSHRAANTYSHTDEKINKNNVMVCGLFERGMRAPMRTRGSWRNVVALEVVGGCSIAVRATISRSNAASVCVLWHTVLHAFLLCDVGQGPALLAARDLSVDAFSGGTVQGASTRKSAESTVHIVWRAI
jgi:primosomal replication protein N